MYCSKCGKELAEDLKFCDACGTSTVKEITKDNLPEQYKPLGAWAYFGLTLLFSVPLVGFIFLIIFSFNSGNINRRNYARSYWCAALIVGGFFLLMIILGIVLGAGAGLFERLEYLF